MTITTAMTSVPKPAAAPILLAITSTVRSTA